MAEPISTPAVGRSALGDRTSRDKQDFVRWVMSHPGVLVFFDLALGVGAYALAWIIRGQITLPFTQELLPQERWTEVPHPWVVLVSTQVFLLYIFGLYDELRRTRYREVVAYVAMVCLTQLLIATSVIFLSGGATAGLAADRVFPRSVVVLFAGLNFLLICSGRFYVKRRLQRHRQRVLIVAESQDSTREIVRDIERSPWMGMEVVGLVVGTGEKLGADTRYPVLGPLDDIENLIRRHEIEEVILASEPTWKDRVLNSMSRVQEGSSVRIDILPSAYEMVIGKLRHINIHDTPLIPVRRTPNEPFQRLVKRALDLSLSALGLALTVPLFILLPVLIKATSQGPAFYLQDRVGLGGRVFRLIKFRTMINEAEKPGLEALASENDPRVTRVGRVLRRFRLDELPQLVNVFLGQMSFVGPRPERPGFVTTFEETVPGYSERYRIKPGITGLAQVRSHYHTTAENKLKYDLAYIYNYSFSLDLILLVETVKVILTRQGS